MKPDVPLCIDLDGTLLQTDLLIESALLLLHRNPLFLFNMLLWLLRGKANLKREIARRVDFDPSLLPYNPAILSLLRRESARRDVVLVTASDESLARAVATHVGHFSSVMASDGSTNLTGASKASRLIAAFGERGFDYAGNARIDMQIWKHSRSALVVGDRGLVARAAGVTTVSEHIIAPAGRFRAWLKALRIHQWIKNLLVFLPLLAAHRAFDADSVMFALLGFFCFGLCASGVYLLNDLLDLPADRRHPEKRKRPFAAGTLPLSHGLTLAPFLAVGSFALATWFSLDFALVLAGYYMLTLAYSLALKRRPMLDVIVLAGLYTVRIIAGIAAIQVAPSFWLLAFSMFIFLSLAILKRYTELLVMRGNGKMMASGRGYAVDDLPLLQSMGTASGYLSVLVLALYINSSASELLYRHPQVLSLLCPLLLYWVSRAWVIAHRGLMHHDPVVFAAVDRTSRILLLLAALIMVGAT